MNENSYKPQKAGAPSWVTWIIVPAACFCLLLVLTLLQPTLSGGTTMWSDLEYMSYAGPVLPMTVQGDGKGIQVQRKVNYDFSPYEAGSPACQITDAYTLTNSSGADRTLTLLYPFPGSLQQQENHPVITVNGATVKPDLKFGPCVSAFETIRGREAAQNIRLFRSFTEYETLLADGAYEAAALDAFPVLDQPVIVYRLHDYRYSADTEARDPTLTMSFSMDYSKTIILNYGMDGISDDPETGSCSLQIGGIQYRPQAAEDARHPQDGFVIVLGEDIGQWAIQGYQYMGGKDAPLLEDLGCTVTRYEATLGDVIRELLQREYPYELEGQPALLDLYCGAAAELLTAYGPLSDRPMNRYSHGFLWDVLSSVHSDGRVFYLAFPVAVADGAQVTVEAVLPKEASRDYAGKTKGRDGYDMAANLGSNLTFTSQEAGVSGFGAIEILRQNFGFDLKKGITRVTLDPAQDHYWMEIRRIGE